MIRILIFAAAIPIAAAAGPGSPYAGQSTSLGASPPFPEILQDPERENCAIYVNHFQAPAGDIEVWNSPAGPVTFKFIRGEAYLTDQVIVWDVPDGHTVLPYTHTLEEHERDFFCIVEYLGG